MVLIYYVSCRASRLTHRLLSNDDLKVDAGAGAPFKVIPKRCSLIIGQMGRGKCVVAKEKATQRG